MARPFIQWDATRPGFGRADYAAADRVCRATRGSKHAQRAAWSHVAQYIRLLEDGYRMSGGVGWVAPIGVPTPSWGAIGNPIDRATPAWPAGWPATPTAGYYYVNYNTGTDSGRTYGTPNAPRATPPEPVPAGAYVEIAAGTISSYEQVTFSGTEANPCWFRCDNITSRALYRGSITFLGAYGFIENIGTTDTGGESTMDFTGDHLCFRHVKVNGIPQTYSSNNSAIYCGGAGSSSHVNNCVLYDMLVQLNGDLTPSGDIDVHGMQVARYSSYIWIVDSDFDRNGGDGVQCNPSVGSANTDCHHVYFGRNKSHGNRQTGFWCKYGSSMVISENELYDHVVDPEISSGAGTGCQYEASNIWWLFNRSHNNVLGFHWASADLSSPEKPFYWIGNRAYNNESYGWSGWGAGRALHFINNAVYGCAGGIDIEHAAKIYIENNILSGYTGSNYHILVTNAGGTANTNKNNCFYPTARNSGAASLSNCKNNVDPLWVNPATYDFHLQSGSQCRSAGLAPASLTTNVYSTFQTAFGVNIQLDMDAGTRATWDIGPDDYGVTGVGSPPTGIPILSVR